MVRLSRILLVIYEKSDIIRLKSSVVKEKISSPIGADFSVNSVANPIKKEIAVAVAPHALGEATHQAMVIPPETRQAEDKSPASLVGAITLAPLQLGVFNP